ncbi:competence protein ComK [Salibacterium sp. K-3]
MESILEFRKTYQVHTGSIGLVPVMEGEARTKVYERGGGLILTGQTIKEIMQEACLDGGSSMEGRLTYVTEKLGLKYRRPIPVNENKKIYAFPLHGEKDNRHSWFFYQHVLDAEAGKYDGWTYLVFRDGQRIPVDASLNHAKQQIMKASRVQTMFEGRDDYLD